MTQARSGVDATSDTSASGIGAIKRALTPHHHDAQSQANMVEPTRVQSEADLKLLIARTEGQAKAPQERESENFQLARLDLLKEHGGDVEAEDYVKAQAGHPTLDSVQVPDRLGELRARADDDPFPTSTAGLSADAKRAAQQAEKEKGAR